MRAWSCRCASSTDGRDTFSVLNSTIFARRSMSRWRTGDRDRSSRRRATAEMLRRLGLAARKLLCRTSKDHPSAVFDQMTLIGIDFCGSARRLVGAELIFDPFCPVRSARIQNLVSISPDRLDFVSERSVFPRFPTTVEDIR